MSNLTLGDLAQSFQLRRQNARLTTDIARLADELASGRKSDLSGAVRGEFGPLAGIERQLESLTAYAAATTEAELVTGSAQLALDRIHTTVDELGPRLMSARTNGNVAVSSTLTAEAAGAFEEAVGSLNTQAGGRSVFSGAATDRPALADADTIMADLRAFVAGETTAAGVAAKVDAWFGPGGGFETSAYTGSTTPLAPFRIGEGETAGFDVRADSASVRETLKGLALGALADDGPLDGLQSERLALAERAGTALMSNQTAFSAMRAEIGLAEADIAGARTENLARKTALATSRNEITSADPYQTAVELQEVQIRLETLYRMTARLSDLSLVNYLR